MLNRVGYCTKHNMYKHGVIVGSIRGRSGKLVTYAKGICNDCEAEISTRRVLVEKFILTVFEITSINPCAEIPLGKYAEECTLDTFMGFTNIKE